jgi:enterochelin esterase-like enzyme
MIAVSGAFDATSHARATSQADESVNGHLMTFEFADPDARLTAVRLRPDIPVADGQLDFLRNGNSWQLTVPQPPVSRMEYLLELAFQDGTVQVVPDPACPRQFAGAFGVKSVREFAGYAPPAWLGAPAPPGLQDVFDIQVGGLDRVVKVRTWRPSGAAVGERLPLLVVHDGPEYDLLASLARYLAAGTAAGWLPTLRAALLDPGPRNRWYSANAGYARALARTVIPALVARMPATAIVGMGTSLGALAMLHAHCRHPDAFDALFLQSGSFFQPRYDSQEERFRYYRRITGFVAGVNAGRLPGRPVPVALTCGTIEENLANNRSMTQVLRSAGYPADLHEVPDGHNYTAWRDAFDPYLTQLLGHARQ